MRFLRRILAPMPLPTDTPDPSLDDIPEKPKRKNSRAKGATKERSVAKLLSEWFGVKFWRTPQSGGSVLAGSGYELAGDLVCDDQDFPFHIEVKNNEQLDLHLLIKSPKGGAMVDWMNQAWRDCPARRWPILICTRARQPNYFCLALTRPNQQDIEIRASKVIDLLARKDVTTILWRSPQFSWLICDLHQLMEVVGPTGAMELRRTFHTSSSKTKDQLGE